MPDTRDSVFGRVFVDYEIRGTARITWTLRDRFWDPQPHSYQLQVSTDGDDTWEDVGAAVVNGFTTTDSTVRLHGQRRHVRYRVVLTTPDDTYTSPVAAIMGFMDKRAWLIARAIIRRAKIAVKQQGLRVLDGQLYKRKAFGTPCPEDCVDPYTGGIVNSDCDTCKGTGWTDGYWHAVNHNAIDLSPEMDGDQRVDNVGHIDMGKARQLKFVGLPIVEVRDMWVDAVTDKRYTVNSVQHTSEINHVPVVAVARVTEIPYSAIEYTVPLEGS